MATTTLELVIKATDEASSKLKSFESALGSVGKNALDAKIQLLEASAGMDALAAKAAATGTALDALKAEQAARNFAQLEASSTGLAVGMSVATTASLALTAALVGTAAVASSLAIGFEKASATLQNQANLTDAAAQQISGAILDMGRSSLFSAQEMITALAPVAGRLEQLTGTALTLSDAQSVLTNSSNLAAASGSKLAESTNALVAVMLAYKVPVAEAATVSDQLFNASRLTGIGVNELATVIDRLHERLGIAAPSLADTAALLESVTAHGLTGSRGLLVVTSALDKLTSGSKEVNKTLRDLGIGVFDSQGNFIGLRNVIAELGPVYAKLTAEQQANTSQALFGNQTLTQTILDGLGTYDKYVAANKEAGTSAKDAARQAATLAGQFAIFKNDVESLAIAFGDKLLPVIHGFIDVIHPIEQAVEHSDTAMTILATTVGVTLVAAIGLSAVAFAGLAVNAARFPIGIIISGFRALTAEAATSAVAVDTLAASETASGAAFVGAVAPMGAFTAALTAMVVAEDAAVVASKSLVVAEESVAAVSIGASVAEEVSTASNAFVLAMASANAFGTSATKAAFEVGYLTVAEDANAAAATSMAVANDGMAALAAAIGGSAGAAALEIEALTVAEEANVVAVEAMTAADIAMTGLAAAIGGSAGTAALGFEKAMTGIERSSYIAAAGVDTLAASETALVGVDVGAAAAGFKALAAAIGGSAGAAQLEVLGLTTAEESLTVVAPEAAAAAGLLAPELLLVAAAAIALDGALYLVTGHDLVGWFREAASAATESGGQIDQFKGNMDALAGKLGDVEGAAAHLGKLTGIVFLDMIKNETGVAAAADGIASAWDKVGFSISGAFGRLKDNIPLLNQFSGKEILAGGLFLPAVLATHDFGNADQTPKAPTAAQTLKDPHFTNLALDMEAYATATAKADAASAALGGTVGKLPTVFTDLKTAIQDALKGFDDINPTTEALKIQLGVLSHQRDAVEAAGGDATALKQKIAGLNNAIQEQNDAFNASKGVATLYGKEIQQSTGSIDEAHDRTEALAKVLNSLPPSTQLDIAAQLPLDDMNKMLEFLAIIEKTHNIPLAIQLLNPEALNPIIAQLELTGGSGVPLSSESIDAGKAAAPFLNGNLPGLGLGANGGSPNTPGISTGKASEAEKALLALSAAFDKFNAATGGSILDFLTVIRYYQDIDKQTQKLSDTFVAYKVAVAEGNDATYQSIEAFQKYASDRLSLEQRMQTAGAELRAREMEATDGMYQLQSGLVAIAELFAKVGVAAGNLQIATTELQNFQNALNGLLQKPTKESAALKLKLDELERQRLLLIRDGAVATGKNEDPRVRALDAQIQSIQDEIAIRQKDLDIIKDHADIAAAANFTDKDLATQAGLLVIAIGNTAQNVQQWAGAALFEALAMTNLAIAANNTADALNGIGGASAAATGGLAPGQIAAGNINLNNRPVINNPDGSISTVRSITIEVDGKYYLIPTAVGGKIVSDQDAIQHFKDTGENFGEFDSEAAADAYAQKLHEQQAAQYESFAQQLIDAYNAYHPDAPYGSTAQALIDAYNAFHPDSPYGSAVVPGTAASRTVSAPSAAIAPGLVSGLSGGSASPTVNTTNIEVHITADSEASDAAMRRLAVMVSDQLDSRLRLAGLSGGAVNQNAFTPTGGR